MQWECISVKLFPKMFLRILLIFIFGISYSHHSNLISFSIYHFTILEVRQFHIYHKHFQYLPHFYLYLFIFCLIIYQYIILSPCYLIATAQKQSINASLYFILYSIIIFWAAISRHASQQVKQSNGWFLLTRWRPRFSSRFHQLAVHLVHLQFPSLVNRA